MSTAHSIDVNLQVSAMATGVSPIDGGRISFPANIADRIEQGAYMICKRITFADLATSGSNRVFDIVVGPPNPGGGDTLRYGLGGPTVKNLVGENVLYQPDMGFLYLRSNVPGVIATEYANIPELFVGEGIIILAAQMGGDGAQPETESVFKLTWSLANINITGQSNFYCDLILSAGI